MGQRWAIVSATDNSWLQGPLDAEPAAAAGERVIPVVAGYPDACLWSPERNGFVDIATSAELIAPAAFLLLLSQAERIAIRGARAGDGAIEDFWEMVLGSTDGLALNASWLVAGVQHLVSASLLTADRATAVLTGTSPIN